MLPAPPAGLYATYDGQQPELGADELAALRAQVPALPPSFVQHCPCGGTHDLQDVSEHESHTRGAASRRGLERRRNRQTILF